VARPAGRYPFTPYPNRSWFKVAFSDEVRQGQCRAVDYFGRALVILRDVSGTARVLDGICPEHGLTFSRLDDGTIQCVEDGAISGIDVNEGVSSCKQHAIKTWPTSERNGLIYCWYDRDHGEPTFEIPLIPEYGQPGWTGYNKLHWVVRTHIQEVAENAVDLAHFAALHEYHHIPIPNIVETTERQLIVDVTSKRKILWLNRQTDLHLEYTGMGCVIARVASPDVDLVAHLTPTPVDDEHINVNLSILFKKTANPLKNWAIRNFVFREIKREFERDIMVWERKVFHSRPVLCVDDGPIGKVRAWARTFY
jgi:hypothetical protein